MTLIAGFKYGNQGCIISDFRITNEFNQSQQDIGLKYIGFDNRLMIYMAGKPSLLLPRIEEILPTIKYQLNFENVDQADSPLKRVIEETMISFDKDCESSIIGVFCEKTSNIFKMFRMDILYSNNDWKIDILPDQLFTWQIIGTGSILMEREFFPTFQPFSLYEVFCNGIRPKQRNGRTYTISVDTVAETIESIIRKRLLSLGQDVFKKLGISPVMNVSTVEGCHLEVLGREYENITYYADKEAEIVNYSILKGPGDTAKLIDKDNVNIRAYQTNSDFPGTTVESIIYDPLGVEGEEDIVIHPKYTMTQFVECNDLENNKMKIIVRNVKHTEVKEWMGIPFQIRRLIKSQTKTSTQEVSDVDETILIINQFDFNGNEESYWEKIDLFNPEWIKERYGAKGPFKHFE